MEETKFASTQVLKALHEDLQKQPTGTSSPKTAGRTAGERVASVPDDLSSKKWILLAAVSAVVILGVGGWAFFGSSSPQPPAASSSSPPAPPSGNASGGQLAGGATVSTPPPPAATPPVETSTPPAATNTPPAATGAKPAAAPPATSKTPPPPDGQAAPPAEKPKPVVMVPVTLEATFPFAVLDGGRQISAPATSHELSQPAGKTLTLAAPDFLLRQTVRIDGSPGKPFDFKLPNPGTVDVRTVPEWSTCDVVIEGKNLGQPPISKQAIASGPHRIDIVCGGQTMKSDYANIVPGQPYVARMLK